MSKRDKKSDIQSERKTLAEIINTRLDIPPDILPHGSLIEIRGQNSLTLCGKSKILLYTPENIRLSLYRSTLSVEGERLVCTTYHKDSIEIDG